jgi:regulator of ribosome biosynthesis
VKLPEPITKLPRQKPAPAPKVETKWDKYAKDKGIQNKKRDRMVWDEDSKTWKPRWGYKAMTDTDEKNWIIEYKQKDDHTADMFEKRREDKKLRVLKNQKQQVNNKLRGPDGLVPQSADLLPAGAAATLTQGKLKRSEQEGNPKDTRAKGGLGKKRTMEAIKQTQVSTASLGRFDDKMKGEGKRPAPPVKGKKRIGGPNERMDDVARDKSILDRVLGKLPSRGSHSHGIDLEDPAYQVGTNKRKKGRR